MQLILALLSSIAPSHGRSDEWPQYNGPSFDRVSPESLKTPRFPEGGPRVAWRIPMEAGFSSFAVAGGRAYTLDRRTLEGTEREVCLALDADTGEELRYQIVGEDEADIKAGMISVNSPIARALIGKAEGDVVDVKVPSGIRQLEIVALHYV